MTTPNSQQSFVDARFGRRTLIRNGVGATLLGTLAPALLAACGSDEATTNDSDSAAPVSEASSDDAAEAPVDVLSVGVLIPGAISDGGFMQSAYEGVKQAESELGDQIELTFIEQVADADMQQALETFAQTSGLVITIGGQTDGAVRNVAPNFPDVKFVEVGGPPDTLANLAMYDPKQAEIAFVAGAAAALMSTTGKVTFIAGVEIPPIVNTANEFANGAKYARPDIEVRDPSYTGDFDDVSKAKEAALAAISDGVDVIYQILNLGLQGLVQAAEESDTKVIGGPLPQPCDANGAFAAHTRSDIGLAARYAIDQVLAGTWEAEYLPFGLNSDLEASGIEVCTDDPEILAAVDQVIADIVDGTVTTV